MFVNHDNGTFFAVEFGQGPRTVVAQGGWAGSWELWSLPFSILSRSWRAIAYDHRGSGATVIAPESITFEALVSDVFMMLDFFGVEKCILAAESAGAAVALQAAAEQPMRFAGLMLVDGHFVQSQPEGLDSFRLGLATHFEETIGGFVDACIPVGEPDCAAVRRWGRQILTRSGPEAALRLLTVMDGVDMRRLATQVAMPALLVHSEGDAIAPLAVAKEVADAMPNGRLHVLPGGCHVPTVTNPTEIARLIDEFAANDLGSL